jgi:hypothetical protein
MNRMKNKQQIIFVALLVLVVALLRVAGASYQWFHFVPIAGIGIFSGAVLQQKNVSYLIPLAAMFLSDLLFEVCTRTPGFYGISQVVNYAAIMLVTFLGTTLTQRKPLTILGATLTGSMVFFLISNFGTFLGGYYNYSWSGLVECYVQAIPFYKSEMATNFFLTSFLSDIAFTFTGFGLYAIYNKKYLTKLA